MAKKATIIGVAESTHYLVGELSDNNELSALPNFNKVSVCDSLLQAKQLLREQNYQHASLIYQTAYDEMCGLDSYAPIEETILLK